MEKIKLVLSPGEEVSVSATHILTLKTSMYLSAALYSENDRKILVTRNNTSDKNYREWGMYISQKDAESLISIHDSGKTVDDIVYNLRSYII